ncbi:restriction endonuclease subunit S [Streptomyces sp. NPDC001260]|uniref:restriction endonuclease subunit S n=1 Tax=Streptomyces sp. NPDC001260 TaxID=3364551 RepID=UPI0036B95A7E
MRSIDEMLQELCPHGVKFKELGTIAELVRGNGMPKSDFTDEGVGCIHYGQIYTHYGTWATEVISHVLEEKAAKLAKVNPGDIIITNTSENLDDVGKAVAWLGSETIVTGGHATVLKVKPSIDSKYLAYWFQSPAFRYEKKRRATGTKVIDVSANKLATVKIPVPPLEVQREIVKALDQFAKLEAELGAELEAEREARHRQYVFYRDKLVSGTVGADYLRLGDVGGFVRGRRFTKNDVVDSGIPSIHYGEIYTTYGTSTDEAVSHVRVELHDQLRYAEPGSVVFAGVGETVEDVGKAVAWLGNEPVATHDDTFVFTSPLNPKYVAYAVQTKDFHRQKERHVSRAKVKRLSAAGLADIKIPVPNLAVQEKIVETLDSFHALVKDIDFELPAEISFRRNQYEHYRDRLLTFKEAVT